MSQVQFDENSDVARRPVVAPGSPTGILKFLIDMKVAKSATHAERILLVGAGVALLVALLIPFAFSLQKNGNPSEAELERYIQIMEARSSAIR